MPKYLELVRWIREGIEKGTFSPGQKLYSENELAKKFVLSRQTVRHAISILEEEGILTRVQGSGTYVKEKLAYNYANRKNIAVITTYVDSYIFPQTIKGIGNLLSEHGYTVQIAFTNNQIEREREILTKLLTSEELGGIIIEATKSALPNPNLDLYRKLEKKHIQILFINSYYPQLSLPHVTINDRMCAYQAVSYLISRGHKKIGGIFKCDDGQGLLRYEGYCMALSQAGLSGDESCVVWIDTEDFKNLSLIKNKLLSRMKGCSGVLCYNDEFASKYMELLKEEKINVPEDLSLVSIDDSELASICEPQLSSVPYPMEKLGEKAANNLLALLENPEINGTYEFEAKISIRRSVKNLRIGQE